MNPWQDLRNQLTSSEAAVETTPEWPPPITFAQFKLQPIEKPRPVLENLLDISSRMIFGGGSKTYKTWAMTDMALSINAGVSWWGFSAFKARCIYINFELKDYYMRKRMVAIETAKKINGAADDLLILNLRGYDVSLTEFKTLLLQLVQEHGVIVAFIDPFYRLVGGQDERHSSIINVILAAFDEINRLTGTTVVFAAHFTKGNQAGKESIDRISGGGSINRDPDSLVTLTKHETEHAFTVEYTLRDFAPIEPFVVKWEYPLLVRDNDLDPEKIKGPGRQQTHDPEQLLRIIKEGEGDLPTSDLIEKCKTQFGWSKATFYRKLNDLKQTKRIWFSVANNRWDIE